MICSRQVVAAAPVDQSRLRISPRVPGSGNWQRTFNITQAGFVSRSVITTSRTARPPRLSSQRVRLERASPAYLSGATMHESSQFAQTNISFIDSKGPSSGSTRFSRSSPLQRLHRVEGGAKRAGAFRFPYRWSRRKANGYDAAKATDNRVQSKS
jgi:hypothetical protein